MNYIVGDIGNTSTRICLLNKKFTIIKSYILLKVRFAEDIIILAMGSKDKNKFTVDMQTDLVEYLIKIIEINLLNIK